MKQTIYFAHANGFPSPCYREMFRYLLNDFDLSYIDMIGHMIEYPVTDNWHYLTQQLIHHIERDHKDKIIGVGHSLGGVLHFLAACERPDLYQSIVLLDSPVFGGYKSKLLALFKQLSLIDYITPAKKTQYRKNVWASKAELYDYLKTRKLFQGFDEVCLEDYMNYGMEYDANRIALKFNREIEWAIYRTLPHHLPTLKSQLTVPRALIYGQETDVIKTGDIKYMKNVLNFMVEKVQGGHLFPFEYPKEAALVLKNVIRAM
jgi:pimeloyl-ACP methyl ester carboxylesterase